MIGAHWTGSSGPSISLATVSKKPPKKKDWERLGIMERCTCDAWEWPKTTDPYLAEIEEVEHVERMCPFCIQEALDAI